MKGRWGRPWSRRTVRRRWQQLFRDGDIGPDRRAPGGGVHRARTRRWRDPADRLTTVPRGTTMLVTAVGVGFVGLVVGGPVGGLVLATYGGTAAALAIRWARARQAEGSRRAAVDAVAAVAAELRAGASVGSAMTAVAGTLQGPAVVGRDAVMVAQRVTAAMRLAQSSGAPLADVLDRLDIHLRAVDRARGAASAQVAGVRASASLLAAMPLAGVGLGFVVGTDPLDVLLRTVLGAACLCGALVLQLAGLAWAIRLSTIEVLG